MLAKNITKILLVLSFTFVLSNIDDPSTLATRTNHGQSGNAFLRELSLTLLIGIVFASDLSTFLYVCVRFSKLGRGCCNRRAVSGRAANQRNRELEYRFRWFEFVGPAAGMLSLVTLICEFAAYKIGLLLHSY